MTRQEKETMGIENARKDFTNERISKIINEYGITSVKFLAGCSGRWSRRSKLNCYNGNKSKYKNRPVYKLEASLRIDEDAWLKEVYRLFSEKLA